MIEIGGSESQSYVIPLEDIDLTYLSKYVRSSRENIPLWSKQELDGELGFYEVKITPQHYDEDDCYHEPSETYKCHMCNTDVPTIFFKEHNESLKHKKHKDIFEKVLERMSNHINLNIDSNDKNNNKDVYYCVPCSKSIQRKNKFKHEATDYHKHSLNNIEILNDFHEIFTEINNNDDQHSIEDVFLNQENRCEAPPPIVPDNVDSDTENNNFNDDLLNAFTAFTNLTINYKEDISARNKISFEGYLKNIKLRYNITIDLPRVEDEHVYIVNPNGQTVKIPHAHFQGYKYRSGETCCLYCGDWPEDITTHDYEESHVMAILQPTDKHFFRPINTMAHHCLVCNEKILFDFDFHLNSDHHKKSLESTKVIQYVQNSVITKVNKTLCDVCNVYIDTHNFISHTNSKKHKLLKDNVTLKQNKITKINANKYLCSACNVSLQPNALIGHINSDDHIASKYPRLSPEYYCNICQVDVPNGGMEIHKKGKPHIAKINANKIINNNTQNGYSLRNNANSVASTSTNSVYSTATNSTNTPESDENLKFYYKLLIQYNDGGKTKVKCSICDVQIPYVRRNIIEHMEGWLHKQQIRAFNELLLANDSQTRVRCKICDVVINNVECNIIEHMIGKLHKSEELALFKFHTIQKQGFDYECECCEEEFRNYLDHINSDSHTRTYQNEYEIDKGLIRKYVYEIDANHGLSLMYRELYNNLLSSNEIIKLNDTMFYCQFCNIRLGRISEIDHVLGERHRLTVESAEETDESDD